MQAGDLVKLKNLNPEWGTIALVTKVYVSHNSFGQVYLYANGLSRSIPWYKRHKYLEVINEGR